MEIGKKIQKIRSDNKLTQDDLAEKYFVTRQTISNWENGKSYPDLETLVKISDDFKISLDKLLKEDYEMVKDISKKQKEYRKVNTYKILLKFALVIAVGLILFPLIEFIGCKINNCEFIYYFEYTLYPFIAGFIVLGLNLIPIKDKIKKIGLICILVVLFISSVLFFFKKEYKFQYDLVDWNLEKGLYIKGLETHDSAPWQLEEPSLFLFYNEEKGVYEIHLRDCRNITRYIVLADEEDDVKYKFKYTVGKDAKLNVELVK